MDYGDARRVIDRARAAALSGDATELTVSLVALNDLDDLIARRLEELRIDGEQALLQIRASSSEAELVKLRAEGDERTAELERLDQLVDELAAAAAALRNRRAPRVN